MNLSSIDLEKMAQVKSILEKEYMFQNTQATLARRVCINESRLRVSFKQIYNITIHDYLVFVRIEKAKEMLVGTDAIVKEIAQQVGYDVSNLEKMFKRLTGLPPLAWRKMQVAVLLEKTDSPYI